MHTCPEGHTSIHNRINGYYCKGCQERYDGDPVNLKEEAKA